LGEAKNTFEEGTNVGDVHRNIGLEAANRFHDLIQEGLWERPLRTGCCSGGNGASLSGEGMLYNTVNLQGGKQSTIVMWWSGLLDDKMLEGWCW
jgi:hypothetical protein